MHTHKWDQPYTHTHLQPLYRIKMRLTYSLSTYLVRSPRLGFGIQMKSTTRTHTYKWVQPYIHTHTHTHTNEINLTHIHTHKWDPCYRLSTFLKVSIWNTNEINLTPTPTYKWDQPYTHTYTHIHIQMRSTLHTYTHTNEIRAIDSQLSSR